MIQSKKQKPQSDEEVVKKLCMVNGVSYEKIAHEGINISSLEIFFSGFPRMVGLSFFPRLCHLTIVGQNIKQIEGLECCPLLCELWVVECHLTKISGLENCLQLEKLYLYDNKITEINNLEMQINLQVLWLNNNCITEIQGLTSLQNLEELNLSENEIEKIGQSLDLNVSLQNINLSGNKIRSFKELTMLAHLPNLRELALQDHTSTPNPVCLLCNYATHVLYHMPGLQYLDTYEVSGTKVKEVAEATVMKKMMYYNMRVRTAHRDLAEIKLSLTEKKKILLQIPEESIRTINYTLKNLERDLSNVQVGRKKSTCTKDDGPPHRVEGLTDRDDQTTDLNLDPNMEQKILNKMDALRERLAVWTKRTDEIEALHEKEVAQVENSMDYTVQFLLMGLESVGNIRLEEGCSTDSWFTLCCDLLLSRFSHSDYKAHGITGIKTNRVIRIQNSALRLRFEEKLHALIMGDESGIVAQRRLEYLFYVPDPEKNSEKEEILDVLEGGFKTAKQYEALGREGAIPLSNSLSVIDQPRVEYSLLKAGKGGHRQSIDRSPFRQGQVIISKVYVGNSMPIQEGEPVDRNRYPTVFSVYRNIGAKHRNPVNDERPHSAKAHSGLECSLRQRQWFMFDNELVLPEYVVFFEYIAEDQGKTTQSVCSTERDDTSSNDIILDKDVLNMEPVSKPQPRLLNLSDKILLQVAQANVLSQITILNLHGNRLNKLKDISRLMALRHLTISFNDFTRLDDIGHMLNLEFLDASYNRLETLEGLRGLGKLKQLDVRWNMLTKAREDSAVLREHTPVLLKLDSRHNPWKRPDSVRMTILGRLPTLTHLDDVLVTDEETVEADQLAAESQINQACVLAHSRTNSERPRSLSLLSTAQLLCLLTQETWSLSQELESDWAAKVTVLNLDSQRISKVTNLNNLVNLRWASFNDNDISEVEGLDSCQKLEELSFNNNSISTLSGLSKLHCLNKLSLDGNQLSSLDASVLEQLPNLSFLSVENNYISSLHGIQRVRSLLELYIGNNQISTSRDIYYLKGLSNLIILDLYGNPLVERLENYRIYVVFHLSSLKALDGVAVEGNECKDAKDMFEGRLTVDMVAEKLGLSNPTDLPYLNLQSCSIRRVDLTPAELFCNLRSVNLNHNNLTSFSGLIYLPNVKHLCLNYNQIESILPKRKTRAHLTNRQILHNKVRSSGYGQQGQSKGNRDPGPIGSLEPLMGSLEVLHLSHNGISNMANLQLSRLTNLKALFLQGNEITQVEGLEGLHQLRELVLDKNRIKTFAENSFIAQTVLLELHLTENRIRELNHLDPLIELRKLFLGTNKLQDIKELDKLKGLPSLTELSIVGNAVACNPLHRPAVVLHLSQLQVLDGVTITLEERTRAELRGADAPPCLQYHGAPLSTTEINLPGLLPLMPRNAPLRGLNVSGGLQHIMHGHDILQSNVDEAQPHYTYKHKKHKQSNATRSGQTEITLRQSRRTGNTLPTTGLLPEGNRVGMMYSNQEPDSRFPNGGKPPP
ncbi:leucine-rich repeat-containing protein 9-like isoform X2 [Sphaeramia orbicularis]|uniref:leucine-rich repeat-containing protein 9-like isoform X2 n=1 Tax=Sphaeramia orbicularis TaxID=375764 RepID=UPI001180EC17|nr:leucine-rich repeat-containing protein 9-like isoform X2 [Sphaeramia orbicularis]